ncbi:hypothetical protein ASPCADRAFT_511265 [Aspergillus carbonarius ITEM 5010]|uniref:Uncharacterized protein n=1 Tax=Aspergillus carbonarius (strain ITEM 5010) TaxID=602072 RepID=A0A1R3R5T3_ASPC5|nr:hypothetical protein ASPCADRAFT_511265 [Aspergillus carbonarius ITEM 5010]
MQTSVSNIPSGTQCSCCILTPTMRTYVGSGPTQSRAICLVFNLHWPPAPPRPPPLPMNRNQQADDLGTPMLTSDSTGFSKALDRAEPHRFLALVDRHRVFLSFVPNFFLALLCDRICPSTPKQEAQPAPSWDPSCLRCVFSGGKATGVEMRVLHESDESEGAAGEEGMLQLRGAVLFNQYYRDAAATPSAFTSDSWFITVHNAYLDAYGQLYITGRSKDTLLLNGVTIFAVEVEYSLEQARIPGLTLSFTLVFTVKVQAGRGGRIADSGGRTRF